MLATTSILLSAYGELEINTSITDHFIIISGFFDEDFVGVALKQNGILIDVARSEVEFGHYYIEMQKPKPGIYELLVGSSTNKKSIEIFIDVEIPVEEIEIEDLPYAGKVGAIIIEPIIETPDEPMIKELDDGELLPAWIKQVFVMWTNNLISDVELIEVLNYLIELGVIQL